MYNMFNYIIKDRNIMENDANVMLMYLLLKKNKYYLLFQIKTSIIQYYKRYYHFRQSESTLPTFMSERLKKKKDYVLDFFI